MKQIFFFPFFLLFSLSICLLSACGPVPIIATAVITASSGGGGGSSGGPVSPIGPMSRTYNLGNLGQYINSAHQTMDGGYICAGYTASFGQALAWIFRMDRGANIVWQKTYNSANFALFFDIQETRDGNFICAGYCNQGIWILKLNSSGYIIWEKSYGTPGSAPTLIRETSDGGFICCGYFVYSGNNRDGWLLRLNNDGSIVWQKTYGGSNSDYILEAYPTSDGGFICCGYTFSSGAGNADGWVAKLNSNGSIVWQKTYGGSSNDYINSIEQTSDGGFICSGASVSFGAGLLDAWILKLDGTGNIVWQKAYGGIEDDYIHSIHQTSDGGFIGGGYTYSLGAGSSDGWVLKLNSNGTIAWEKTYGGTGLDFLAFIHKTSDGGFLSCGHTTSFGNGTIDEGWVLKMNSSGEIPSSAYPNLSQNSSAFVIDTTAIVSNSLFIPTNTNITPANILSTETNASAAVYQQAP